CLIAVVVVARKCGLRCKTLILALTLVGISLGFGLTHARDAQPSASERITTEFGARPRIENYRGALEAFAERPLLGWGPARYSSAVTPHRSLALDRLNPDDYFIDAHDWPLHFAVTTGLLGLVALASWLVCAARRARGPLL